MVSEDLAHLGREDCGSDPSALKSVAKANSGFQPPLSSLVLFSCRESDNLWPLQALHDMCTCAQNTHLHEMKINENFKNSKIGLEDQGASSVVKHLPTMSKALGVSPTPAVNQTG